MFAPSAHNSYSGATFPGVVDSLFELERASDSEQPEKALVVKEQVAALTFFIETAAASLKGHTNFWKWNKETES